MNINYELIPYKLVEKLIEQNRLHLIDDMNLNAGYKANLYGGAFACIEINKTVFRFPTSSETIRFFAVNRTVPTGFVKYKMDIDADKIIAGPDLQYQLMSYDFFQNYRIKKKALKILSETILKDGRVSVLYTWPRYDAGQRPRDFFLAIGRMVFKNYRIEPLISLDCAIQDGSAIYWRPELAGTMDYIPSYSVTPYNKRQNTIIAKCQYVKTIHFTNGLTAEVYRVKSETDRHYVRLSHWFYSFKSLADCDVILNKIQLANLPDKPADKEAIRLQADLISKRLGRYISSDLGYHTFNSKVFVNQTGSFTNLNALS